MMTLQQLLTLVRKPALYERSAAAFWNDDHISKGMLAAHLDPHTDAASRNPAFIDRSVEWIASLLPSDAHVLDLGCGPGLYTHRFASRGMAVTGIDLSSRSIAYATAHDSASRYLVQDYLTMEYHQQFDVCTLIWCDYGALIPREREQLLSKVFQALRPGGLFILDVFTPAHNAGRTDSTNWSLHGDGGFWSCRPHLCLNAEYHFDDDVSVARTVILEDDAIRDYNIWNTCFTPESLEAEVGRAGFVADSTCGDVTGAPWTADSATLAAVFRKPEG